MTDAMLRGSLRPGDCVIVYSTRVRSITWFVLAVEHDGGLTKVFWMSANPDAEVKLVEGAWNLSSEVLNDNRKMVLLRP